MRKRLLGLIATGAIVVAACGPSAATTAPSTGTEPSTAPETTAPSEAAVTPMPENVDDLLFGSAYQPAEGTPGGTVVIADWQVPSQMNQYYDNAFVNTQVWASALRGLWTVSHDGKWVPDLGATVPSITNGMIRIGDAKGQCPTDASQGETPAFDIDIDLKPGLLWSDGTPLTLNDLKYTWEWNLDPAQTGLVAGTDGWDLITAFDVNPDGLSATVSFCTGYAGVLGLLSLPILPEHYMSGIPVADAPTQSYPVGPGIENAPVSGPFKFASASSSAIEMVRNDNFKAGVGGRAGPAYLDRVVYRFFEEDKSAMIAAAIAGELDVATDMLQFDVPSLEGLPSTHELLVEGAWEYEHFDMNQSGGGPGKGHPALTDPNVRMALAHAINKEDLFATVSPGVPAPEVACSPVVPGLYFRTDQDLTCIEYDPAKSVELLDAAGWVDTNGNGIRDKDGVELSLLHCHTGAGFRVTSGDYLTSVFREIGVELKNTASGVVFDGWNQVEPDAECNLARGNYDTSEFAWVQTFDLLGNFYGYHSSRIPTEANGGDGNNYVRLNNPEMDAVLDELFGLTDPTDQVEKAAEVQRLHTELQPEVVLYYRSSARVVNDKLENFFKNPGTASDMWNIEDWYCPEGNCSP